MAGYMDRQYAKLKRQTYEDDLRREREERKEREMEDRLARERDREETHKHREWQRDEAQRRDLERQNRGSGRNSGKSLVVTTPVQARPTPAPATRAADRGTNVLGVAILGIGALGLAASFVTAVNSQRGSGGASPVFHGDFEVVCTPAPAKPPMPKPSVARVAVSEGPTTGFYIGLAILAFVMGIALANFVNHLYIWLASL